jgi:hypothetical protein
MKYRKLRIAWSVWWGVVAVVLCVLWMRSYKLDLIRCININEDWTSTNLRSDSGIVYLYSEYWHTQYFPGWRWERGTFNPPSVAPNSIWRASITKDRSIYSISAPYWMILVLAVFVAIVPSVQFLSLRFSLRTLLVVMTAVAVVLGAVAYAVRS